ncbi:MAG: amidohydrolase [Archaeoglobaceae archaeon]
MRRHANSSGYRGVLIDGEDVKHGYLIEGRFEESRIDFEDFVFTPTFFNAHTHLGDAIAKDPPFTTLSFLVAPGGYKFKILDNHSTKDLRDALLHEVEIAKSAGTIRFLDFREGGEGGLKSVEGIDCVIPLGRPNSVEEALKMRCAGFGMSSVRDHEFEFLCNLRKIARKREMIFAIHAGEADCEDVERALELEPDFVVHMNSCGEMIKLFIEKEIPIVSCIRSNFFFGLEKPEVYKKLSSYEKWLLGTDNAMLFPPSMLEEIHFAAIVVKNDSAVFKASFRGFEIFKEVPGYIVFHRRRNLRNAKNLLSTIVRRAGFEDIETIILP